MNLFSNIPIQLIETTITNALLQGLANPSKKGGIDPVPYQLYQIQQQNSVNPQRINQASGVHDFTKGPYRPNSRY